MYPQPKVFSSISQGYQENPYPIQMLIYDKGKDSLSNPSTPSKTKILICPECSKKGHCAIDCPNESNGLMWWKWTLHG